MKIKRIVNGQEVEFELSFSEIIMAHEEYELDCAVSDIKEIYKRKDCDINLFDEQLKSIARQALHNLTKNDGYYEAYWTSFEYTFDEYMSELMDEEE